MFNLQKLNSDSFDFVDSVFTILILILILILYQNFQVYVVVLPLV